MTNTASKPTLTFQSLIKSEWRVFALFWLITFVLYLPAAKAGMVGDFFGWLLTIRTASFSDYVNRPDSLSLYQFTQLVTYAYYKMFGANPWAWHLLNVTLHALNCLLLFSLMRRLFEDSHIKEAVNIALGAILLYCFAPHNSEVIVHEPCFHYLLAFLVFLLILRWVQQFHHTQKNKYIWMAVLLYFPSTYALELFYLTPWFVLTLAIYYRVVLAYDKAIFRKVLLWFFVPQLVLFGLYEVALSTIIHMHVAHVNIHLAKNGFAYLTKPPQYLFHMLFLGRYFPLDFRRQVYAFCETAIGLVIFYSLVAAILLLFVTRMRWAGIKAKVAILLFLWTLFTLAIVVPLDFPQLQLVLFDRYTYFMLPFMYAMMLLLLSIIPNRKIAAFIFVGYACVNIYLTVKTNYYWKRSAYIVNRLVKEVPDPGNKTLILLNLPENMNGMLMIGSQPTSVWKLAHNLFSDHKINTTVYDVASYNMVSPGDGAHVKVLNDSTLTVTLNQWGTWWWYRYRGAVSYENDDYRLEMKDVGHWYQLTLKHPASEYMLLYQKADMWRVVDWNKKDEDQD